MTDLTEKTLKKRLKKYKKQLEKAIVQEGTKGLSENGWSNGNGENEDRGTFSDGGSCDSLNTNTSATASGGDEQDCNGVYEVDYIIDARLSNNGDCQYLVKWKGYNNSYNTWEPTDSFIDDEVLNTFWLARRLAALEMLEDNFLPTEGDIFIFF